MVTGTRSSSGKTFWHEALTSQSKIPTRAERARCVAAAPPVIESDGLSGRLDRLDLFLWAASLRRVKQVRPLGPPCSRDGDLPGIRQHAGTSRGQSLGRAR